MLPSLAYAGERHGYSHHHHRHRSDYIWGATRAGYPEPPQQSRRLLDWEFTPVDIIYPCITGANVYYSSSGFVVYDRSATAHCMTLIVEEIQ